MFSSAEREEIRARLLESAREDARVVAAALTGSAVAGAEDEWSDIDLAFAVADGVPVGPVIEDWTEAIERELEIVHHWDLPFGPTVFRLFLLPNLLQIDLAFTPAADFGAYGPNFRLLFGEEGEREPVPPPGLQHLVGYAWVYVLHARRCIDRGNLWQADHFISAARDSVLTLACLRLSLPTAHGRGFDRLPAELTEPLQDALVRAVKPGELRRALRVATAALLEEVRRSDPALAERLAAPFGELAG
jgi:predicted nucleotidyltransferase